MSIPRKLREFMMSMMDEAEKQISSRKFRSGGLVNNYILPIMLSGILIVGLPSRRISSWLLSVVSIIYIYISYNTRLPTVIIKE